MRQILMRRRSEVQHAPGLAQQVDCARLSREANETSMEFLRQIEQSAVFSWVSQSGSLLGYPTILFLHTLGLATVAGLNAGIDLRVLGFAPKLPLGSLTRIFPVMWTAFAITAVSGTTLLLASASTKLVSPVFYIKMLFIALALTNMQLLKKRVLLDPLVDAKPLSGNARMLAITSLLLWIAATTAGRLMAYIGPS